MKLKLYKMTSDRAVINKKKELIKNVDFILKENTDFLNPTFILKNTGNIIDCNYIYVDKFKRYYYIDNFNILDGKRIELICSVDALESFKNELLEQKLHIVRQQFKYNMYMYDNLLQTTTRPRKQVLNFDAPEGGFILNPNAQGSGYCYVLTVI